MPPKGHKLTPETIRKIKEARNRQVNHRKPDPRKKEDRKCAKCESPFLCYVSTARKYCSPKCSFGHSGCFKSGKDERRIKQKSGRESYQWSDTPTYTSIHKWLVKTYGNPKSCKFCGKIGEYGGKVKKTWNIQWAKTSKNYERDINSFIGLCVRCHWKQDRAKPNKSCEIAGCKEIHYGKGFCRYHYRKNHTTKLTI